MKASTFAQPAPCTGSSKSKENPAIGVINSFTRLTINMNCWPPHPTNLNRGGPGQPDDALYQPPPRETRETGGKPGQPDGGNRDGKPGRTGNRGNRDSLTMHFTSHPKRGQSQVPRFIENFSIVNPLSNICLESHVACCLKLPTT